MKVFDKNNDQCLCDLEERNVNITYEINQIPKLSFDVDLQNKKWNYLAIRNMIECDGQLFRIYDKMRNKGDKNSANVIAYHIYSDLNTKHLPIFPQGLPISQEFLTDTPESIIATALQETNFNYVSVDKVFDTQMMDFFIKSKTTPASVIDEVIRTLNKGEILLDCNNISIVRRLGSFTPVTEFTTGVNCKSIIENESGLNVVNRLYPYGKDGLQIDNLFIDSKYSQELFGVMEGYKDYEASTKEVLLEMAKKEFAEDNYSRLDLPSLVYSADYCGNNNINLGDFVKVFDGELGIQTKQRICQIVKYPYEMYKTKYMIGSSPKTLSKYLLELERRISHG